MNPANPGPYASYPARPQSDIDEQHLHSLAIGFLITGILELIFSSFFIGHFVIGLLTVTHVMTWPSTPTSPPGLPPSFIGWIFLLMGGAVVLGGWSLGICTLIARRFLIERTHYVFILVVSGVGCALAQPVGTALGIFTFIVLLRPSVKELFGVASPSAGAAPPGQGAGWPPSPQ